MNKSPNLLHILLLTFCIYTAKQKEMPIQLNDKSEIIPDDGWPKQGVVRSFFMEARTY